MLDGFDYADFEQNALKLTPEVMNHILSLDKPNIGLLSAEFLEDVKNMPQRNIAVELLEKLLKDEVKVRMTNDVVSEKAYPERIMETLRKYHNRALETAQVIASH